MLSGEPETVSDPVQPLISAPSVAPLLAKVLPTRTCQVVIGKKGRAYVGVSLISVQVELTNEFIHSAIL